MVHDWLPISIQADNGRFRLFLEDVHGAAFTVFDVSPERVLNEASVLIRVANSSALDYERVTQYTFYVSILMQPLS